MLNEIKMKNISVLVCLFIGFNINAAEQGNAENGKARSITCSACHGVDGNSAIPMNPKLAGQHEQYLVKQLTEFKLAIREICKLTKLELELEIEAYDPIMNDYIPIGEGLRGLTRCALIRVVRTP